MAKDPIHLCDVLLYDSKAKREYRLNDVVLAGNDKDLIWNCKLHRDRIISRIFKTKTRIKKQEGNLHLSVKQIDYKVYLGDSFHKWGLSK